jgi:hypothetical protein
MQCEGASADSRNRLGEDVNEVRGTVLSSKVIKTESVRLGSTEGTAPLKRLSQIPGSSSKRNRHTLTTKRQSSDIELPTTSCKGGHDTCMALPMS